MKDETQLPVQQSEPDEADRLDDLEVEHDDSNRVTGGNTPRDGDGNWGDNHSEPRLVLADLGSVVPR